jgi:hypothetical protein
MVVVLVDKPSEYKRLQTALEVEPTGVNGFYARRDRLLVLPIEPLDNGYQALSKLTAAELWSKGFKMNDLLNGIVPRGTNSNVGDRAQTLALLQKAVQDESEMAAFTQEGVAQMLTDSGILPRTVPAPRWIEFGMPACFAMSRGVLWGGFGTPNWQYLLEFKQREDSRKLDPAELALPRLLTNAYFRDAAASQNEDALIQARTLSWSLAYFLANTDPAGLLRYYQELAGLPRELELDDAALQGCFARSFNLTDTSSANRLASQWYKYIGSFTALPITEKDLVRVHKELKLTAEE